MPKPFVDVAAGVLLRPDGMLLLGQRPVGKPWEGWWELPGGKIEPGETVLQALGRELEEELGITAIEATPWVTYVHEYPKSIVRLSFCRVTGWQGTPTGRENQALAWVDPLGELSVGPVLPATEPPLRWLRLPERYLVSQIGQASQLDAYLDALRLSLRQGVGMVQFREPGWAALPDPAAQAALRHAYEQVLAVCREAAVPCMVNSVHPRAWWNEAAGVQLRAADARQAQRDTLGLRQDALLGVSAHNADDLACAGALQADFAVLGHVLPTPSHSGQPALGWAQFAALAKQAGLPVYAIGGQSPDTQAVARAHGAHGIAAMRGLLASRR